MRATYRAWRIAALSSLMIGMSLMGPTADAATGVWLDPRGDMVAGDRAAPMHVNGDMLRVRVSNGERYVRVRVMFTDLARRGRCLSLSSEMVANRQPASDPAWFYVNAGPGCEDAGSGTWKTHIEPWTAGMGRINVTWEWERNFIEVRISRVALHSPRWVQVQVRSSHFGAAEYFGDRLDRGWTPRVYRG